MLCSLAEIRGGVIWRVSSYQLCLLDAFRMSLSFTGYRANPESFEMLFGEKHFSSHSATVSRTGCVIECSSTHAHVSRMWLSGCLCCKISVVGELTARAHSGSQIHSTYVSISYSRATAITSPSTDT